MGDSQAEFVKGFQEKLDSKIKETEMSVLSYWKEQLDRVLAMKPESVASLQVNVRKVSDMMGNRINMMKRD